MQSYRINPLLKYIICCLLTGSISCVDEKLSITQPNEPEVSGIEYEGYSISFQVNLNSISGTKNTVSEIIEDTYDSYIDTKNKFRILFFDGETGNFIFEAIDRTVNSLIEGDNKRWNVHIPMNYIVDRKGHLYDADAIREYLREHPFKIAILANWPNAGEIAGGNIDDSDEGEDDFVKVERPGNYIQKGEPNWGYLNSIFCPFDNPNKDLKNINNLHHLEEDGTYSDDEKHLDSNKQQDRPSKKDTYGFIMEGNKMGVRENWVKSNFEAQEDKPGKQIAREYIRETVGAEKQANINGIKYGTLWYLWNFAAGYTGTPKRLQIQENIGLDEENNKADDWIKRNHYNINANKTSTNSPLYEFTRSNDFNNIIFEDYTDDAKLSFNNNKFLKRAELLPQNDSRKFVRLYNQNQNNVAQGANGESNKTDANLANVPYGFKITINSSGTLKVLCASSDSKSMQLSLYNHKSRSSNNFSTQSGDSKTNSQTPIILKRDITMNGDPQDYYIYCREGTAADIYQIEYISDEYLYGTNREAIEPSEIHPIPMYGIQNFEKIDSWKEGTSYNLSMNPEKTIFLLRSVAKIEVFIPQIDGSWPSYVYMRSLNRHGRCEPMDVETPTEKIWNNMQSSFPNSHDETYCEWFKLQEYGAGYRGSPSTPEINTMEELPKYKNWLSWFYGSWSTTKWQSSGTSGWSFQDVNLPSKESYPHVFNPCINRSDFAKMIDKGEVTGGYRRYVMYMPEKYIDDPNYPGLTTSIPKVAHVEFRYENSSTMNYDDNSCHRVYFTSYPNEKLSNIAYDKFESDFEKDPDALNTLWPIMRNHIYQFYLGEAPSLTVINSKVLDWGYHEGSGHLEEWE